MTHNFLNETFPNKWIGKRCQIERPPRSPDLTPFDYFYWRYLKNKVYETKPATINELRARILDVSNSIRNARKCTAMYLHPIDTLSSSKQTTIEHLIH